MPHWCLCKICCMNIFQYNVNIHLFSNVYWSQSSGKFVNVILLEALFYDALTLLSDWLVMFMVLSTAGRRPPLFNWMKVGNTVPASGATWQLAVFASVCSLFLRCFVFGWETFSADTHLDSRDLELIPAILSAPREASWQEKAVEPD